MLSEFKAPDYDTTEFELSFRDKGVILLLYATAKDRNAVDWQEGNPISDSNIELHHIFPQSMLTDEYTEDEIDDIANLAFVTPNTNKILSSREPSDYLLEIPKKRLKSQFIPMDTAFYDLDEFSKFLEERRGLITRAVVKYLHKMMR